MNIVERCFRAQEFTVGRLEYALQRLRVVFDFVEVVHFLHEDEIGREQHQVRRGSPEQVGDDLAVFAVADIGRQKLGG
ncbi:hypothetical protein D3C71_1911180 [compost metagenome]